MSLFKRPAWARAETTQEDETEDSIFSHSERSFAQIAAAEQRQKQERAERQREKREEKERRVSAKREVKEEKSKKGSSPKRRRITLEEGEDLLGRVGLSSAKPVRGPEVDGDDNVCEISPRRSPRKNKTTNGPASARVAPAVIELGVSSSEHDDDVEISYVQKAPAVPAPVEDDSDDEFAELARQARARKLRQENTKKSQTPDQKSPTPGQETVTQARTIYPTPPAPDPPVKLFISSRIPNTKPLMVYRRLSQRLQEIRTAWCQKQGFDKQFTEGVFLIHRMRKVFDVTSCRSLGLDADAEGNITMKGAEGVDGVDQVHLEAVTEEIFKELQAEREREERKRQSGEVSEDDAEAGAAETPAVPEAPGDSLIRIVLRDKNRKTYKLKVRPTTEISKILSVCRTQFEARDGQAVSLEFDGDRLDPEGKVSETDIADMDYIDVHVS